MNEVEKLDKYLNIIRKMNPSEFKTRIKKLASEIKRRKEIKIKLHKLKKVI